MTKSDVLNHLLVMRARLKSFVNILGEAYASALTAENCRFCGAYIDHLGYFSGAGTSRFFSALQKLFPPNDLAGACAYIVDCFEKREYSAAVCARCFGQNEFGLPIRTELSVRGANNCTLMVVSGCDYSEWMKRLIRRLKYDKDTLLARDLAAITMRALTDLEQTSEIVNPVFVPVPLHWRRRLERGYNQAALIGSELSRMTNVPMQERGLRRANKTKPQNKLSKEERESNLFRAFRGNRKYLHNKTVILIDDVCTSGSTLIECAEEAYRSGAHRVFAVTPARAVLLKVPS